MNRRPNYRFLGAALTFGVLIAIPLAIFVDLWAATIFAFGFVLIGGVLAVLMGDLPLPDTTHMPTQDSHMADIAAASEFLPPTSSGDGDGPG